MRSTMHDVHAESREVTGSIEGELDESGAPRFEVAHLARLRVPVESMHSGNRLQDMGMRRRLEPRRYPVIDVAVDGPWQVDGGSSCRAAFRVTAHGRTQSFEEDFLMRLEEGRLVLEGEHTFDMRDFDISPPRLLALRVQPAVTVRARIVADREAS
jgi:hypothetical protein